MADLSVFDKIKSINDYQQAAQEFDMRKKLAQAQIDKQAMGGNAPASIQEWNAYNSMSPQDQQRYLQMKRSDQIMNLGGQMAVRNPLGGIQEQYTVTPKMTETPEYKAAQNYAEKQASNTADIGTSAQKALSKSNNIMSSIDEAKALLPVASGGVGGTALSALKGYANISDETTQANEKLKLLSGWLVSNVPRMEGPQSNFDVQNYQTMAADVGNTMKSIGDRTAALEGLISLQNKYAQQNQDILNQSSAKFGGVNIPRLSEADLTDSPVLKIQVPVSMPSPLSKAESAETIFNAKKAIRNGANPDMVKQRLIENGIDPAKAGL